MSKFIDNFKKFTQAYVSFVQKILIFVLLSLLYLLGFGLTKLWAVLFRPKFLSQSSSSAESETFWEKIKANPNKDSFFLQI